MRIIKRGVNPEDRVITASCYNCGTSVEFTQREGTRYSDYRETYYSISCPVCGKSICGYPASGNSWMDR